MKYLSEEVAYLRGLAEGLEIESETKEGKIICKIIDVLENMADTLDDMQEDYDELVEYVNNRTKVKIICPEHGVFEQTPQSHLLGNGCHRCSGVRNTEEFIEASIKIHGNKYDYSLVEYVNTRTPVKIICPDHGVFEQTPTKQLCGHGCWSCTSAGLSKISENISQLLESNNIKFQKERIFEWMKRITYLRLDFYLPEYNVAIECHGR